MVDRKSADYDRSLFFLVLSLVCIWLIVDNAVGAKYLNSFLATLFPFMSDSTSSTSASVDTVDNSTSDEKKEETDDKEKNKEGSTVHVSTNDRTHGGSSITFK